MTQTTQRTPYHHHEMLTIDEASRYVRKRRQFLDDAIRSGSLRAVKLGTTTRIHRNALLRFLGEV